jgi:hypothetical protein
MSHKKLLLHISPVLSSYLKQRMRDLADRAVLGHFHEAVENIFVLPCLFFQPFQQGCGFIGIPFPPGSP